ncbi:MAG: DUF3179 domain-containing protein [Desulfovibrionaceae bacterium]
MAYQKTPRVATPLTGLGAAMLPLCLMAALAVLACLPTSTLADAPSEARMQELTTAAVDTGLKRDDIRPIYKPKFYSVADAALALEENMVVFALDADDVVRIYPQYILVWHEVVNDTLRGKRISVTYSPVTGSVACYRGQVGAFDTPFGTSGKLVNGNTLLYDWSTNSKWPQILGAAIDGTLKGAELDMLPMVWTTWAKARKAWPHAQVLAKPSTQRPYGKDPYGSYTRSGTYYQNNVLAYPLTNRDTRLPFKEPVLGLRQGTLHAAVVKNALARQKVLDFEFGVTPLTALYDAALDTVRVFDRRLDKQTLHFTYYDGKIYDQETKTEWTGGGRAGHGLLEGGRLTPVPAMDAMWFAWSAFFPDTTIRP